MGVTWSFGHVTHPEFATAMLPAFGDYFRLRPAALEAFLVDRGLLTADEVAEAMESYERGNDWLRDVETNPVYVEEPSLIPDPPAYALYEAAMEAVVSEPEDELAFQAHVAQALVDARGEEDPLAVRLQALLGGGALGYPGEWRTWNEVHDAASLRSLAGAVRRAAGEVEHGAVLAGELEAAATFLEGRTGWLVASCVM